MTKDEAIEMLKTAPRDDKPSKLNPSLTRRQAAEIVEKGIKAYKKETLDPLFEKRVYQVCPNLCRQPVARLGCKLTFYGHSWYCHRHKTRLANLTNCWQQAVLSIGAGYDLPQSLEEFQLYGGKVEFYRQS